MASISNPVNKSGNKSGKNPDTNKKTDLISYLDSVSSIKEFKEKMEVFLQHLNNIANEQHTYLGMLYDMCNTGNSELTIAEQKNLHVDKYQLFCSTLLNSLDSIKNTFNQHTCLISPKTIEQLTRLITKFDPKQQADKDVFTIYKNRTYQFANERNHCYDSADEKQQAKQVPDINHLHKKMCNVLISDLDQHIHEMSQKFYVKLQEFNRTPDYSALNHYLKNFSKRYFSKRHDLGQGCVESWTYSRCGIYIPQDHIELDTRESNKKTTTFTIEPVVKCKAEDCETIIKNFKSDNNKKQHSVPIKPTPPIMW
jgi:hypothetical protein